MTPAPGRVWAYIGSPAGRARLRAGVADGTAVVARDYLDHIDAAFRALGDDQHAAFLASSDLGEIRWPTSTGSTCRDPGRPRADWHDVECASYAVDLPLWRELAAASEGPLLDVGAGTGRVALDLARRGHAVTAIDSEAELVHALRRPRPCRGSPSRALAADARSLTGGPFRLALLPMQVVQLLGGTGRPGGDAGALRGASRPAACSRWHSPTRSRRIPADEALPPLPDVLERDGWVFSSLPVAVRDEGGTVAIDRVRQAVSPSGDLTDEFATITLDTVTPRRSRARRSPPATGSGAARHPRDARLHREHGRHAPGAMTSTLRVCALYPD